MTLLIFRKVGAVCSMLLPLEYKIPVNHKAEQETLKTISL